LGPEKLQFEHVYLAAISLHFAHLTISYFPQLGHLNLTAPLSFKISFLHEIHIGFLSIQNTKDKYL